MLSAHFSVFINSAKKLDLKHFRGYFTHDTALMAANVLVL